MENIHKEILGLMGKINIHCRDEGDVIVVDLAGQLDIYNSGDLELLVDAYITRDYIKFAVNLENVTYLDSSTISIFIKCLQKLGKMGGKLVLVGLNGSPKEVFDMAKLHDVFKITSELPEALKQMEG
jgi:anti-sigma B factor antagonist